MDLAAVVITTDAELGDLVRAQVENLGCRCTVVDDPADTGTWGGWADAAVVDLAVIPLGALEQLHAALPSLRVLAISQDEQQADDARRVGAGHTLVEPFAVAELVEAVRALDEPGPVTTGIVDLRVPAAEADDRPWWATR